MCASLPHGVHADDAPRYPHKIRDAPPELRDALVNDVSSSLALAFAAALSKAGEGLVAQRLLLEARRVKASLQASIAALYRLAGHTES